MQVLVAAVAQVVEDAAPAIDAPALDSTARAAVLVAVGHDSAPGAQGKDRVVAAAAVQHHTTKLTEKAFCQEWT